MVVLIRHRRFKKAFQKLPSAVRKAVVARLRIFVADPFDPLLENHPLHGEYAGFRSIRVTGDYRIIYDEIERGVYVLATIGTHSELYE